VAVATVRALAAQVPVSEDTIRAGLSRVHWAGRLQLVQRPGGQQVLLDGAHNVGGAEILAAAVREYFPSASRTLVLGILQDKDWPGMCEILAPLSNRILPVRSRASAAPQRRNWQEHASASIRRHRSGRSLPCGQRWRRRPRTPL